MCVHFFQALELLEIFAECRKTGLDRQFSNIMQQTLHREGMATERIEFDVLPRHVAYICMLLIYSPEVDLVENELHDRMDDVFDPNGDMCDGYSDLCIENDTYLNLGQFRKLFQSISFLMCLSELDIIPHFVWVETASFQIPKDMAALIVGHVSQKHMDPVRFSQTDFIRLCYACDVVDRRGLQGIPATKVEKVFSKTLSRMPDIFAKLCETRPRMQRNNTANVSGRQNAWGMEVVGWTEFSCLLVALFDALPKDMFLSPLQMCITFLQRLNSAAKLNQPKLAQSSSSKLPTCPAQS